MLASRASCEPGTTIFELPR
ncbi:rCG31992, partial [Rattus norvegicus]